MPPEGLEPDSVTTSANRDLRESPDPGAAQTLHSGPESSLNHWLNACPQPLSDDQLAAVLRLLEGGEG